MAKLAFSFILICFFFFFAFSNARIPSDLAANDVVTNPAEKPQSEPETTTLELEPQSLVDSSPLTVISFRPINDRHFPRRPFPLTFRHGHHCRHRRPRLNPWGPRSHPYGDDMILSLRGGDAGDRPSFDPVLRGGVHQIPATWVKFRHVEGGSEIEMPHHHLRHHRHHHHHHDHDEERQKEEERHKHGHLSGFLRTFRKFLNHF